jgi:small subunit ribosomal protein S19
MPERVAFKGKMPGELPGLPIGEYTKLITSRQRRWLKRNSLQYKTLTRKIERLRGKGSTKPIRTHFREALILPSWIGLSFEVHNGKEFQRIDIAPNMLGYRLGDFVYTVKRVMHSAPGVKATRGSKFVELK